MTHVLYLDNNEHIIADYHLKRQYHNNKK